MVLAEAFYYPILLANNYATGPNLVFCPGQPKFLPEILARFELRDVVEKLILGAVKVVTRPKTVDGFVPLK